MFHSFSYFSFLNRPSYSPLCIVAVVSLSIGKILSLNLFAKTFVFGELKVHHILAELIDRMNYYTFYISSDFTQVDIFLTPVVYLSTNEHQIFGKKKTQS